MSTDRLLPEACDVLAPDGSEVRILASGERGSMAHFTLQTGQVSLAVAHRTVEEVWYIVEGQGRMWRKTGEVESVVDLRAGLSLAIPVGTAFQFRNDGEVALKAVGVTMPPWPGMDEAFQVAGKWQQQ
jgi:mannose-6-phosphate isomerase-like protein (cupin superfamily)